MVMRWFVMVLAVGGVMFGCVTSDPELHKSAEFSKPADRLLYVVPFLTIMVPAEVEAGVFDHFVDALNEQGAASGYEFVILKEDIETIDPEQLAGRTYLTGEIYGYVEESGCCSTSMRLKSRARLFQPGQTAPTLELSYPKEVFFEHDYSTLVVERRKLMDDISTALADSVLAALNGI